MNPSEQQKALNATLEGNVGVKLYEKDNYKDALKHLEKYWDTITTGINIINIPHDLRIKASKYLAASYIRRNEPGDKQKAYQKLNSMLTLLLFEAKYHEYHLLKIMVKQLEENIEMEKKGKKDDDLPKIDLTLYTKLNTGTPNVINDIEEFIEFGQHVTQFSMNLSKANAFDDAIKCQEMYLAQMAESKLQLALAKVGLLEIMHQNMALCYVNRNSIGDLDRAIELLKAINPILEAKGDSEAIMMNKAAIEKFKRMKRT